MLCMCCCVLELGVRCSERFMRYEQPTMSLERQMKALGSNEWMVNQLEYHNGRSTQLC